MNGCNAIETLLVAMRPDNQLSWRDSLKFLEIPFDIFGRKVTVRTSPGGVQVDLKISEIGKYITKHYLSKIGVTLPLIEQMLDIKFECTSSVGLNYEKFKPTGLNGFALSTLQSAGSARIGDVTWTPGGMISALSEQKKSKKRPVRDLAFNVRANLTVNPKVKYLPLRGKLGINYACRLQQFDDRIDLTLMDVKIKGGFQFALKVDAPLGGSLPLGMGAESNALHALAAMQPRSSGINAKSDIQTLSIDQSVRTFGLSFDTRQRRFTNFTSDLDPEYLQMLMILAVLWFMNLVGAPLGI